ncbi:hypothetical protein [Geobacillus subterraneus]|uniref:hypothetical protein n=1 Tax=Geobacillus subterraneus TaxID=129338 RepID=UPI001442D058|nr:hypothetical protein [Geobacillus subterraneus]QIZ66468.1 hypothetical protein HF500_03705 [Geobacillus subterraneus]
MISFSFHVIRRQPGAIAVFHEPSKSVNMAAVIVFDQCAIHNTAYRFRLTWSESVEAALCLTDEGLVK